ELAHAQLIVHLGEVGIHRCQPLVELCRPFILAGGQQQLGLIEHAIMGARIAALAHHRGGQQKDRDREGGSKHGYQRKRVTSPLSTVSRPSLKRAKAFHTYTSCLAGRPRYQPFQPIRTSSETKMSSPQRLKISSR